MATPTLTRPRAAGIPDRSKRRLSEVTKKLAYPKSRIVSSEWDHIANVICRDQMGIEFDGWQHGLGQLLLAKDAENIIVHTVGGFHLSAMRQVGKTYFFASAFFGLSVKYPGLLTIWSAHHSKALDCSTEILTANRGWTTMADIRVGDEIFHPSGATVAVEAVKDVMIGNDCYEVQMSDGRSLIADAGHLWTVTDANYKLSSGSPPNRRRWQGPPVVLTTKAMHDAGLKSPRGRNRFALPQQKCLADLPERQLSVDPYLLGAWLGDGSSTAACLTCATEDLTHWCTEIGKTGYLTVARKPANRAWRIAIKAPGNAGHLSRSLAGKLTAIGVLGNKHVPDEYLTAATSQRLALLQGLMDTDGSINAQGNAYFTSTTRQLSESVLFLARSLGWRATIIEDKARLNEQKHGPVWRVTFTPKQSDGMVPFRLQRKAVRVGEVDNNNGRFTTTIDSIQPVASRPVRCIKVAADDGLFLAGRDLIPTHNTHEETFQSMQAFAARVKVKPLIKRVLTGSGDEAVEFHNGSRILFGARERGFGRGVPGVDILMSDEGQILSERAMQNMLATLNTSNLGIHVYAGTPPKPEDNSEQWMRSREEAWAGGPDGPMQVETEDLVWAEIGADNGCNLDDRDQWLHNPSYPHRTPAQAFMRLRRKLNDDGWRREGLGLYDEDSESDFNMSRWEDLAVEAEEPDRAVLVLDASPNGRWASIGMATDLPLDSSADDARVLVMTKSFPGTAGVVKQVEKLMKEHDIVEVSITGAGKVFETDLTKAMIEYETLSQADMSTAYGNLQKAIKHGTVAHAGQPELTFALANAKSRFLQTGEVRSFDRREDKVDTDIDISPAVAMAGALYRWGLAEEPLPFIM